MNYRDLIGAPYKLGGRGPETYDCAGLAIEMQRREGRVLPLVASPEREAEQLSSMLRILRSGWVEMEHPGRGSLVFFPSEGHVGTMLDSLRFLHTTSEVGSAHIDRLESWLWRTKRRAFYVPV